jgi:hypothetical protein
VLPLVGAAGILVAITLASIRSHDIDLFVRRCGLGLSR